MLARRTDWEVILSFFLAWHLVRLFPGMNRPMLVDTEDIWRIDGPTYVLVPDMRSWCKWTSIGSEQILTVPSNGFVLFELKWINGRLFNEWRDVQEALDGRVWKWLNNDMYDCKFIAGQ